MKWLQRRRYRDAVRVAFDLMLGGFPEGFSERVWQGYPGIETAVSSNMDEGNDPCLTAVQLVSAIITNVIEGADAYTRAKVLDQLKGAAGSPPEDAFAKGILRIESTAYHWALAGKFDMQFRDVLMSELIGALAGKAHNERVADRIAGSFLKHAGGS
jgi:hypothetical protein